MSWKKVLKEGDIFVVEKTDGTQKRIPKITAESRDFYSLIGHAASSDGEGWGHCFFIASKNNKNFLDRVCAWNEEMGKVDKLEGYPLVIAFYEEKK